MSLNYGRPANPEAFIIGALKPLGLPVGPERAEEAPTPSYMVTAITSKSDRYLLCATVSVHSFGTSRAQASEAAWDADNMLLSLTPGDIITLPDGSTASAWVNVIQSPSWVDYGDPYILRYVGRYQPLLRFT